MSVILFRVDERLIHGQVVIGWSHQLRPDRYIVVDDGLVRSEWEQQLYRLGAGGADVLFAGVQEARERLQDWRIAPERSLLLTRDIATMRALAAEGALRGEAVNLGGIHHAPGRREVLTYLHLSADELAHLRELRDEGVLIFARDLPDAHKVSVESILA